jgi:hypothetical protein
VVLALSLCYQLVLSLVCGKARFFDGFCLDFSFYESVDIQYL